MRSPLLAIGLLMGAMLGIGGGALLFSESPRQATLRPAVVPGNEGKPETGFEGRLTGSWDVLVEGDKLALKTPFQTILPDAAFGKIEIDELEGNFHDGMFRRSMFIGSGGQRWHRKTDTGTSGRMQGVLTWFPDRNGKRHIMFTDEQHNVWLPGQG